MIGTGAKAKELQYCSHQHYCCILSLVSLLSLLLYNKCSILYIGTATASARYFYSYNDDTTTTTTATAISLERFLLPLPLLLCTGSWFGCCFHIRRRQRQLQQEY